MRAYIHKLMIASVGILLTGLTACSSFDQELEGLFSALTGDEALDTRANLITYEINDLVAGTLGEVVEANGYSDAQKLVISGTFRCDDARYIQENMPGVEVLDISGVQFYDTWEYDEGWDWDGQGWYLNPISYSDDTVNYIPYGLFGHCSNLKEIILPNEGIERISGRAFFACTSLETINIPETVTGIGYGAFYECSSLKAIDLPEGLESLASEVFYGCKSLTEIDLTKLSESITELYWASFRDCTSLTTVKMSEHIRRLEDVVFENCSLTDFNETFKNIKELGSLNFGGCKFTNVDLSNIETMGNDNFSDCTELTTVVLPSNITKIENGTFDGCTSLSSINIPSSVTELGDGVFQNTGFTTFTVPDQITEIGSDVFRNCQNLTSVTFPSHITKIMDGTFADCPNLTSFTVPSNITEIGNEAFAGSGLTSITLHDNITTIGEGAFRSTSLTTVDLPNQLTEVAPFLFFNCQDLKEVTIPESVKTLGEGAFEYCYSLTNTTIPSSVEKMGDNVFHHCSSMTSAVVPATVTTVEGTVFDYCYNMKYLLWYSPADVGDQEGDYDCYLYVFSKDGRTPGYGPNWRHVVVDGVVDNVTLSRDNPVSFPIPVTAKKISYTCNFYNWSYNYGWQTIALPFTPTHITHEEKGELAPFNSGKAGAKPFWLRELTTDGFKDVTTMEPNKGYIISMPYNPDLYLDDYNIRGDVTFSAENVYFDSSATDTAVVSVGTDYSLYPTYKRLPASGDIYAINTTYNVYDHEYGSVFVRCAIEVQPYEAYLMNNTATLRSVITMDNKRSAVRSRQSSTGVSARGVQQKRKPMIEDM